MMAESSTVNANGLVVVDGPAPVPPLGQGLITLADPAAPLELFCICKQPETEDMIACDVCEQWFHPHCFGINLVSSFSFVPLENYFFINSQFLREEGKSNFIYLKLLILKIFLFANYRERFKTLRTFLSPVTTVPPKRK